MGERHIPGLTSALQQLDAVQQSARSSVAVNETARPVVRLSPLHELVTNGNPLTRRGRKEIARTVKAVTIK